MLAAVEPLMLVIVVSKNNLICAEDHFLANQLSVTIEQNTINA